MVKDLRFGEKCELEGLYTAAASYLVLHFEKVVEHPLQELRKAEFIQAIKVLVAEVELAEPRLRWIN